VRCQSDSEDQETTSEDDEESAVSTLTSWLQNEQEAAKADVIHESPPGSPFVSTPTASCTVFC
jgi:hypothetical protein